MYVYLSSCVCSTRTQEPTEIRTQVKAIVSYQQVQVLLTDEPSFQPPHLQF